MTNNRLPFKDDDDDAPFIKVPCSFCGTYCDPSDDPKAVLGVHSDVRCSEHIDRDKFAKPV